jgi:hypothetical protein
MPQELSATKLWILVVTITLAVTFLFVNTGTVRSASPDFPARLVKGAGIQAHAQSRGTLEFVVQEIRGPRILATDIQDVVLPSGSQTWSSSMATASGIILDKQGALPPVTTVNGTPVTLFSYILPGGTLGATDEIWVQTAFKHTTGSASTAYNFAFGATSGTVNTSTGAGTSAWDVHVSNNGATDVQIWYQPAGSNGNAFLGPGVGGTSAIDTTQDVTIAITAKAASNTNKITPEYFAVYLIRHA